MAHKDKKEAGPLVTAAVFGLCYLMEVAENLLRLKKSKNRDVWYT